MNGLDGMKKKFQHGTPLHCAVLSGCLEKVQFLLDRGADPHIRNASGVTAMDEAGESASTQILELFRRSSLRRDQHKL